MIFPRFSAATKSAINPPSRTIGIQPAIPVITRATSNVVILVLNAPIANEAISRMLEMCMSGQRPHSSLAGDTIRGPMAIPITWTEMRNGMTAGFVIWNSRTIWDAPGLTMPVPTALVI